MEFLKKFEGYFFKVVDIYFIGMVFKLLDVWSKISIIFNSK